MAKGKSRKSSQGTREGLPSLTVKLRSRPASNVLSEIQDMRAFTFEPDLRPARLFTGGVASVGAVTPARTTQSKSKVPYQLAFQAPADTLVCVRRHRRKQVLFAKRKTGKSGQKKARWNKWSSYRC